MLESVQKVLNEYTRVFLITAGAVRQGSDWEQFCNVMQSAGDEMCKGDLPGNIFVFIEEGVEYTLGFPYAVLSHKETQELYDLYMTYEFSDKFSLFADGRQYGTIFNYVATGILTQREAVMAILGYKAEI